MRQVQVLSPFIDEKTETFRDYITCSTSQDEVLQELGFELR